jgi:group I intron endonuclease
VIFIINAQMSIILGKIYKITNTKNNLIYVGCTINSLEQRFYEHIYRCFKTDYKSKLYNSIKKYGIENFKIDLIEECGLNLIYETEKKYIKEFDTYTNGLNSTLGGEGTLGYVHSPEIRKKISNNTKNGNSHKGKTYQELYGDRAEEEKIKRKNSSGWNDMSEGEKVERIKNIRTGVRKNSKYGVELIKEVKEKLKNGIKVKEVLKLYPQMNYGYLYSIKNGRRWSDI